ncbi:hypothetical protein STIAU_2119 [Stigmatella aurantiaca DW4/3-1]|uniref:Uncharacterized protein n=1 Tax=Stigmatella aurantiaca (strain DW4/3-1) TaxID=378806 RepID=Q09CK9_STIAD|nr:hypothetical protein STIAU_2119 [Stigmatella aurantiaca DW4/3-1]
MLEIVAEVTPAEAMISPSTACEWALTAAASAFGP